MTKKALSLVSIISILFAITVSPAIASVEFDGMTWYHSHTDATYNISLNGEGQLVWIPKNDHQIIVRIPEVDLSDTGDEMVISYYWKSDGKANISGCDDCFNEETCNFNKDITCLSGTGDFRIGFFESDGDYITADGMGIDNEIFRGYVGYKFHTQPHVDLLPIRWSEESGEPHIAGGFYERDMVDDPRLISVNEVCDRISQFGGYAVPLDTWVLWTMKLKRLSSTEVEMSMTYGDVTYTDIDTTDSTAVPQPQKIDVFVIDFANPNPFYYIKFAIVEHPAADFIDDCIVDVCDLEALCNDWLKRSPEPVEPDSNGLVIHYAFDETSGSTAYDSANNYDGQVKFISDDTPATTAWDNAGYDANGCIDCAGDVKVVAPATAFAGIDSAVTVSLWVNGEVQQSDPYWGMAFQGGTPTNYGLLFARIPIISIDGNIDVVFGSSSSYSQVLSWEGSSPSDWEGQWNHYAFILDTVLGKAQIFHNGFKKAEGAASEGVTGIQDFHVCTGFFTGGSTCEYIGKIDDFRVYDYALTENEVLYVANDGSITVPLPLDLPANLYYDNIIDGKDFAEFALEWLDTCHP